jgi:EmrB/QacA subfamily drug resistance transporter
MAGATGKRDGKHCGEPHQPAFRFVTEPAAAKTAAHPRLVLAATIFASSLSFVDGSVMNVGLPAIGQSFASDAAGLQWVINAYLLPLSALILLGGAAGDRFGRRLLLLAGILLFALASILCALAPGLEWLWAGRALQGIGAAMLLPNSLAILGASFSGEARGRAIGIWAAAGAAAGAVGPLIGGWLIDTIGWRSIFAINLPAAGAALLLALRYIDDDRNADHVALDVIGGALATIALAALTWGLTRASGPHGPDVISAAAIVAGLGLLMVFALHERRERERAMMPLAMFVSCDFIGLSLLTFLLYGALGAIMVLLPYQLIEAAGFSATAAGAALLPFPMVIALASPLIGRLAARIGARLPLTIGPAIVACGFLLAMRIDGTPNYWTAVLPAMLVISLGMAAAVAPLTAAVLASVDERHTGVASGFNSAVARTGGLIATASLGAVLAAHGTALTASFRVAMLIGGIAALVAGASAFALLDSKLGQGAPPPPHPAHR